MQKKNKKSLLKKQNKKKQNGMQKNENKIKNTYWSITIKMTISTQFPKKYFLTLLKLKMTLRAYLTSDWPQIFTKCYIAVEVSSIVSFGVITLSTYWCHDQIRKNSQNAKQ